jgi:hypothetical protein
MKKPLKIATYAQRMAGEAAASYSNAVWVRQASSLRVRKTPHAILTIPVSTAFGKIKIRVAIKNPGSPTQPLWVRRLS